MFSSVKLVNIEEDLNTAAHTRKGEKIQFKSCFTKCLNYFDFIIKRNHKLRSTLYSLHINGVCVTPWKGAEKGISH